jgi:archaellum component FlaG (FlaF/FlaG flagellin family)
MKRIFIGFALLFMYAGLASAQQKEAIISVIDSAVFDFGDVKEADGPVTHVFKIKNTGELPLVITKVDTSCGCTSATKTNEPIAPGKQGEVKATFDVNGRPGHFNKPVTVRSNGKQGTLILTIKGNVIPKAPQ